ncbi:hypothetical protein BRADI_3g27069v3 [Brachypodium distachyon]|uniref:Uncharacterized protein n=1 Tax=Brachypodium distachyon TaxID=15368 RepID=A0A2K2CZE5_BRADI|nr:hypothetical protein BRADI_3g27069v3 [Brachypodium distachyon]PNT67404.1 hypothetical protein BRADI_3g27069v3 [Brachypodium distachyon]
MLKDVAVPLFSNAPNNIYEKTVEVPLPVSIEPNSIQFPPLINGGGSFDHGMGRANQNLTESHTFLVKGQALQRWSMVSEPGCRAHITLHGPILSP